MKKSLLLVAFATLSLIGLSQKAAAHATSIGFENAGPGAVTIWLGTYDHGGHHTEGSMQLEGALGTVFGPVITPFTLLTNTGVGFKPAGLIDGVTNFYVQGTQGNNLPLVSSEAEWLAMFPGLPANHWQGATFNGLAPGHYQFTWIPALSPTQEWSPWSQSMNGIFELTGSVVNPNPVSSPATLSLLGLGLLGFSLARKRKAA